MSFAQLLELEQKHKEETKKPEFILGVDYE